MEDDNFKLFFKSKLFYSFVHPVGKELMLKNKIKRTYDNRYFSLSEIKEGERFLWNHVRARHLSVGDQSRSIAESISLTITNEDYIKGKHTYVVKGNLCSDDKSEVEKHHDLLGIFRLNYFEHFIYNYTL